MDLILLAKDNVGSGEGHSTALTERGAAAVCSDSAAIPDPFASGVVEILGLVLAYHSQH